MPSTSVNRQASQPAESQSVAPLPSRPVVIGLYGISGCGKSYLLNTLKQKLGAALFEFYEGSEVIESLVSGGLDAFKKLEGPEKERVRQLAIERIAQTCSSTGRVGVVVGHFMFWDEGKETGLTVCTQNDLEVYTHILYLNVDAEIISARRSDDTKRARPSYSVEHLRKWQEAEKAQMRQLCYDNNILFSSISPKTELSQISTLIQNFRRHTAGVNLSLAIEKLDGFLSDDARRLHTMLVLDGDRTLAAEDTGKLFWNAASRHCPDIENDAPLKDIFSSKLGYSYTAFRQAVLLYEEMFSDEVFDSICEEVASVVALRPEFALLLRRVQRDDYVGAVVITCGLRHIWDKILSKAGLSKTVKVIGGGRITDCFVVTPEVKASLVHRLQSNHGLYTWAFGDSPLDLEMFNQANKSVVVVGEEDSRSKSMDAALEKAIDDGLQACQALLPGTVTRRLNTRRLPLVDINDPGFIRSLFLGLRLVHATNKGSAKLLMAPMRNAMVAGHSLREAHQNSGYYLAIEFLPELLGVEEYSMDHVQGNRTIGHRLRHEKNTLIIPLMRGGEAMAFGVSRAFPLARFVHASHTDDIKMEHLHDIYNIILVDSVVNSGSTIVEFARHIRALQPHIHVVVVTGVVQKQSVFPGGQVSEYSREVGLEVVALRISNNKYTGSGGTDTGNRLFNTTHLSK
ncbi:uracil phosphoribosyltransferase-domain-containing protein [Daldinia sp. FL1419]|nr:uracil phosphoribosyltransferase-domain-containing protein [Daldinia sp. FL1419]